MNIKIKEIIIKRPAKPKYPQDDKNKITVVVFDNGLEWCPTFNEIKDLNEKLTCCYNWNLNNDLWVKKEVKT